MSLGSGGALSTLSRHSLHLQDDAPGRVPLTDQGRRSRRSMAGTRNRGLAQRSSVRRATRLSAANRRATGATRPPVPLLTIIEQLDGNRHAVTCRSRWASPRARPETQSNDKRFGDSVRIPGSYSVRVRDQEAGCSPVRDLVRHARCQTMPPSGLCLDASQKARDIDRVLLHDPLIVTAVVDFGAQTIRIAFGRPRPQQDGRVPRRHPIPAVPVV